MAHQQNIWLQGVVVGCWRWLRQRIHLLIPLVPWQLKIGKIRSHTGPSKQNMWCIIKYYPSLASEFKQKIIGTGLSHLVTMKINQVSRGQQYFLSCVREYLWSRRVIRPATLGTFQRYHVTSSFSTSKPHPEDHPNNDTSIVTRKLIKQEK